MMVISILQFSQIHICLIGLHMNRVLRITIFKMEYFL